MKRVSAGFEHTCGLTTAGDAYYWGDNFAGALGSAVTPLSMVPVPVSGGLTFQSVSAGAFFSCGLTAGGQAYCWGANDRGQLGAGSTNNAGDRTEVPVAVSGSLVFQSVSAGGRHACGITASNAAYCWGVSGGSDGLLGDGSGTGSTTPVMVSGGLMLSVMDAGNFHTCAVSIDSDGFCWGTNGSGALGNGSTAHQTNPGLVMGGLAFQAVSVSMSGVAAHSCGLTTDGLAYCWGYGAQGQLGSGTISEDPQLLPIQVLGQGDLEN